MSGIRECLDDAIQAHTEAHAIYRDARYRVAMGELWGVFEPDEVCRLESALAKLYDSIHRQSEKLARVSADLEFKKGD